MLICKAGPTRSKKQQHYTCSPLAVDIISSVGDELMLDIMLLANDGGEIPACRFVLGARSVILRKMLFGDQGRTKGAAPELHLEYSTNVVRTLVHYCRTNELDQSWIPFKDEAGARELVKLSVCASSFELKGLEELVFDLVTSLCKSHPFLSCAIFDQASRQGESVENLKDIARNAIRQNPEAALLRKNDFGNRNPGVSSLGEAALEEIFGDRLMCTEEITLFRAMVLWADPTTHYCVDSFGSEATSLFATRELRFIARKITARCIDLSKIAPSDLLGVVNDSGLVDDMSVSNALIQLALRVEREGVVVSKCRALAMESVRTPSRAKSPLKSASGHAIIEQEIDNSGVDARGDRCSTEASYDTSPTTNSKRRISNHSRTVSMEQARSPSCSKSPLKLTQKKAITEQVAGSKSPLTTARKKTTIKQEDDNSLADEVTDDSSDMSSHDTPPATVNSKKRSIMKKTSSPPPTVTTPQRATQKPRVTGTPPSMARPSGGGTHKSSRRRTIRECLGHFLAKRVDTLCPHSYNESKHGCYKEDGVPYYDSSYTVDLSNDATRSRGSKAVP